MLDARDQLRRKPVPVNVPMSLQVAHEAPPFDLRQLAPKDRHQTSNVRDGLAPIAPHFLYLTHHRTAGPEHLPQRLRARQQRIAAAHSAGMKNALRARQETAPRNRMQHRAAAAVSAQDGCRIRHRQSVADDEYRMLLGEGLRQIPGILAECPMLQYLRSPRLRRRRRVTERQYHRVCVYRRPILEMRRQRPPALGTHNVGDFAEYPLQPNMRRRRALGLQQHALQVVAVEGARQKIPPSAFCSVAFAKRRNCCGSRESADRRAAGTFKR